LFVTAPQDIAQTLPAAIQLVKWTVACTRVPFVSFLSRLPNISSVTLFILGGKQVPRFSMLGYYEQTKQQQKKTGVHGRRLRRKKTMANKTPIAAAARAPAKISLRESPAWT
jgi:hypothetical protein